MSEGICCVRPCVANLGGIRTREEQRVSGTAWVTWPPAFIVRRELHPPRSASCSFRDESRATNGSDEFQSPSLVNLMKLDCGWFRAHFYQKEQLFIDR